MSSGAAATPPGPVGPVGPTPYVPPRWTPPGPAGPTGGPNAPDLPIGTQEALAGFGQALGHSLPLGIRQAQANARQLWKLVS